MAPAGTSKTARVSTRGRWVVLGLIVLGLAAGTVAVIYWTKFVTVADNDDKAGPTDDDFDRDQAHKELTDLEEAFAAGKQVRQLEPVLLKAKAFVEQYPKYPPAHIMIAKVLIEMYRWDQAYKHLLACLKIDPRQPLVHHLAGTIKYEMGQYDKAEEHYKKAIKLQPREARHYVYLAQVYIKTKRHREAQLLLVDKALRYDPESHEAHATMSDLYMSMAPNQLKLALQHIDKAIDRAEKTERDTMVPYILKRAAVLRRSGDPDGALQALDALLDHERYLPQVVLEAATLWGMLRKPEKAAELYERALAVNPTDPQFRAEAVEWHLKAGNLAAARRHLNILRRYNPDMPAIADLEEALGAKEKELGAEQRASVPVP